MCDIMAVSLPVFEPFDCTDAASSGPRWRRWLARFEVMMSGMKIGVDSNEDKLQRKSLLLHYIGGEGFDVYETLKADDDDYAAVKKKLTDYFMPKTNVQYERYVFRDAKQKDGETLDQFCTRLRKLAINCDYGGTKEDEIKTQIIHGCMSTSLRKKALGKVMTLDEVLEAGRSAEQTKSRVTVMENRSANTETVKATKQFQVTYLYQHLHKLELLK